MYYRFPRINNATTLFVRKIDSLSMVHVKFFVLTLVFLTTLLFSTTDAEASTNPNLFVSAENSQFNNYFSGSMVVEVVVRDNNIRDTDEGKGEPDVTLNGKNLRMVQATDGNWYAYFANIDKAKSADSTVGLAGKGLDFGSICTDAEGTAAIGVDLSDVDGVAYPYDHCSGTSNDSNNVVRKAKSPNPTIPEDDAPGSDGLGGQIGIVEDTWPFVQLFSFDDVTIQYNSGGNPQRIDLKYDEMSNISFNLDRDFYPNNAEVFLTLNDFQLNQDPTDEDSWTFAVGSDPSTFYQAFDNSGNNAANKNAGLINLVPHLSNLGFEKNGRLSLDLGNVMELKTNNNQRFTSVDDGTPNTYSEIITLVERGPNSGLFESYDFSDQSVIGILEDAPRGQTGQITYNKKSTSVLTGFSSALVSLNDKPEISIGDDESLRPGTEYAVLLTDHDQNLNTGARDHLDVFRATAIIPSIEIGSPVTLENARDASFHTTSQDKSGVRISSSVPDSNSNRLIVDASTVNNKSFEMFSVNLGVSSSSLSSILLDVSEPNTHGTNWINYDLRSFENDYDISDFSDTSFVLSFGSLGADPITIVDAGSISSSQGFVQIDDSDVADIVDESGVVFLVINFDSSSDDDGTITVLTEQNKQPIVFDFFSFGLKNDQSINHSIYRFELEETRDDSSTFEGTFEYVVTNQLNILDPDFIQTIQTIDDEIKIVVTNRLIDDDGISISYLDLDEVGVFTKTSAKSDITTNSGVVSTSSSSFRFGQPVTVTLKDSDLNLNSDTVDIYQVINNPNSPNVDTVGKDGQVLLEIKLKDIRYKRCMINGVEHGGLGATGFTLVETGPMTGIFEGVFKMPSKICNKSGTELISPAGGSLDVRYHDSRDSFGNPNIYSLLKNKSASSSDSPPKLTSYDVVKPSVGKIEEIILSGIIDNHKRGMPLSVVITSPDGKSQNFAATLASNGSYRSVISINENSSVGVYQIKLSHDTSYQSMISFQVSAPELPDWVKNNARYWSSDTLSDSNFIDGLKYLVDEGILIEFDTHPSISEQELPDWVKNNAQWWVNGQISDEDFIESVQYLIKKGIIRI